MSIVRIGQGSVKIAVLNNNIAKINETNWELTSNNTIKNKAKNEAILLSSIKVKKGQKINISFKLITKSTTSTTFSASIDNKETISLSFTNFQQFNLNQVYTRTYTATKDCEIKYVMWGNANSEKFEFQFWAELDKVTNYNKHQEDSKILSIQQEMLLNDKFEYDETVKKWYEVHNWAKIILDGVSNRFANASIAYERTFFRFNGEDWDNKDNIILSSSNELRCTHAKISNSWAANTAYAKKTKNGFSFQIMMSDNTIVGDDNANAWLRAQNANGTPIIIYYQLDVKTRLECTAEQTEVLNYLTNKIKTYKNITNITTDSIALIDVTYKKDRETTDNNFQKQIDELKALLSTTKTSAMLLDNMQIDLEREVM